MSNSTLNSKRQEDVARKQNYKVFIASSLSLKTDRQEVEDAITDINDGILKDSYFRFSVFDYVKEETIVQKLELGDAQDPIRRYLYESLVFVLIIRGRVGNLTINEFEDAMARFREGRLPQYIFIFYDEDHSGDSQKDERSISFPEFESKYLAKYELDSACRLVKHERGYYIPFGGEFGSLRTQLKENLSCLIRSDEWPFPGSIRTTDLKKTDFYSDENRLSQCHEKIYYSRPFDKRLEESIDNKQIVFIYGVSLSGKTRAALNFLSRRVDGWAYIFPGIEAINREELVTNEMEQFVKYYDKDGIRPSHYVFIDDIHELDFTEDEDNDDKRIKCQRRVIDSFLNKAIKGKFKLIITSTRKFQDTFLSDYISEEENSVLIVPIREMRDAEFSKALNFFNSYGLVKHNKRLGYNTPGAILIDLARIKNTYSSFLKTSQERVLTVRRCFLKAIKAASIWKNTNFGELNILYQLTGYFLDEEGVENWSKREIDKAITALLNKPQCGITKIGEIRLNIQEYVYRYLIDYEGNIKEGDKDLSEAEKHLVEEIMTYCVKYEKSSPLTMQAGKLGSRSEYRAIIGPWLYRLFIDDAPAPQSSWISALREEKNEKESNPPKEEEDRYLFFYSKMFSNAFDSDSDFHSALEIFNSSKYELRSPNLLADLMRCARSDDDWRIIESLPEYTKYVLDEKRSFVLARLMSLQHDFARTLLYFNALAEHFDYSPAQVARYKLKALDGPIRDESDRQFQRDIFPIEAGLDNLARNVNSESDLSKLLDIIRNYYYVKINDRALLIQISEEKLDILSRKEELTIVDLLSVLNISSLRIAIQGAFGSTSDDKSERWNDLSHATFDFVEGTLYPSFHQTLSNPYTDEIKLRCTSAAIINALIESYARNRNASSGLSYKAIRDCLMKVAITTHPMISDRKMNLMDCYAYSHMLKTRDCGVNETRNLLEEYLIPHIQDANNPIVLSVNLLNSMISTVWNDTKGKDKEKSEKSRRAIIQKILPLYDQYHVCPDVVTYNILLRSAQNETEAVQQIASMIAAGVSPDVYSFCHLASKIDDLQGVLGLVVLPAEIVLPENYELRGVLPSSALNLDTIVAQKSMLLDSEEFWKQVFFRRFKTDEDRFVAHSCFNYLKGKKPELLSNGVLMNVFVQNSSNLIAVEEVKAFVLDNYCKSFPDSFTFSILSSRLAELHGEDKKRQIPFYNELTQRLYYEDRIDWDAILPRRLYLYDSFREHLEFVFLDHDKDDNDVFQAKKITAIGYLQVIKAKQYNPSVEFIYESLKGIEGFDPDIQKQAQELFPYLPQYTHNQRVVHAFQKRKISGIWEAMYKLDWDDYTSATHSFNRIIDIWSRNNTHDPNRFDVVMRLYNEFLSEKGPSSETLSLLVKNANSYDDVVNQIYPAYDEARNKRCELRLDSHFLSSVYRFGHSFEDLKQYTQAFESRDGVPSIGNTASMIRYMLRFTSDSQVQHLLTDIADFLLGAGEKKLSLQESPINLLTRDNVNGQILYSILVYAEDNCLYERADIIDILIQVYSNILLNFNDDGLLVQLLKQRRANNKSFLTLALTRLLERESIVSLPDSILSAAAEGVENYADYCSLIKALKESGCSFIEPIVAPLLSNLIKWIRNKTHPDLISIRRLYSRIVTYSKLNCLNNGHFLPNCVTDDLWSARSMNCSNVRSIVNTIVGKRTLKEQIVFAIRNLPKPYILTLRSIYYYEKPRLTVDDDCKNYLIGFEKEHAVEILNGHIPFNEMAQLCKEWENSGWIPGVELITALYLSYKSLSKNSEDVEIREESNKYYQLMNSIIRFSNENNLSNLKFMYSSLGRLSDAENERHHYAKVNKQAFAEKTDECLAMAISRNLLKFEELVQLASEWEVIGWRPGVRVLASLFIQYKALSKSSSEDIRGEVHKYYLAMCRAINVAKRKNSNLLIFFYCDLGRIDKNKKHYTSVDRQAFYELTKSTID